MPPDDLLRYLHATYAAPNDAVTDGELLRRCASVRDDAAFELLMRRYADLVWKICQAVARNHHAAEDAFQATFLALARKTLTIGAGTVAGWLCRVAYHAALKARPQPVSDLFDDPMSLPEEATERTEIVQVLHEELDRLADRYRAPLILCYLQSYTQAEAARHLGWPLGTVASRVMRGRDRLRDRLIRRGIVLSSGGLTAALTAEPASALPASLVTGTVRALTSGTELSLSVQHLAQGALSVMSHTKIWPAAAIAILVASVVLAFAASTEPPIPQTPAAKEKAEEKEQEKKPVEPPIPVSPAIQALVAASTDIIVADVLETNPSKAEEGARDTVKLKVVRTLLGRPAVGETLSVYYHLLWADEKADVLEVPKFIKGKRYVIFLSSHLSRRPEGDRIEYLHTDQWLSVLPDNINLVKEVAAAVRVSHGDAQGEWSSTDGSIAGLQGRLVVYRDASIFGTPIITVYLDLRNTAGGNNTTEFLLDGAKAVWTVSDDAGKSIPPSSPPGNWLTDPTPRKLLLAAGERGQLRLTNSGGGVTQDRAGHLELAIDKVWEFAKGDKGTYFLTGKIAIDSTGKRGQWYGTMDLPKVRIPLKE